MVVIADEVSGVVKGRLTQTLRIKAISVEYDSVKLLLRGLYHLLIRCPYAKLVEGLIASVQQVIACKSGEVETARTPAAHMARTDKRLVTLEERGLT